VSIFAPADIADFRAMQDDMAFSDAYRLQAQHEVGRDSRNNRIFAWVVVEEGYCKLRALKRAEAERIIADKVGWTNSVAIDLPWESRVTSEDQIVIGNRVFHVNIVNREASYGLNPTAFCEERSH
jgi:SPP1 family predicted phage head-tail adaptor